MKVYTVALPNFHTIPNKGVMRLLRAINSMPGLVGISPCFPYGTLILFETENDAKIARNEIASFEGSNIPVGNNICEAELDDNYADYTRTQIIGKEIGRRIFNRKGERKMAKKKSKKCGGGCGK